ncbi:MAG: cryptochrome/photolyase family protein [Bacteroidota bacterium]
MREITILFPHQLHYPHPVLEKNRPVFLIEESLFFSQFHFHKQKLVLHRASLKSFQELLEKKGFTVVYIAATDATHDLSICLKKLADNGLEKLHYIDPVDDWLNQKIQKSTKQLKLTASSYTTPGFLNQLADVDTFFEKRKTYFQTDFYCWQRKQRNWLMDPTGKPIGGKWTFDDQNRERYPSKHTPPTLPIVKPNKHVKEAIQYTENHFSKNPGETKNFNYPVTHEQAIDWWRNFLETRFNDFGVYEDAMALQHTWLHHAVISPLLNIGLLEPAKLINEALAIGEKKKIPLNSLEGFIRQISGWREFIRIVYEREGRKQRTTNYWKFTRKIPSSFWTGTTGIHPIDHLIETLKKNAYTHHIERLMVLGNFMLLCEFDPDEVYKWFMEWYIDSYDWVMVPNVYGMTQFADGGLMTTKPYISGSNYLLKMGDWDKKKVTQLDTGEWVSWTEIWDGLFWRFMDKQRSFFLKNPRLGMLVKTLDKMNPERKKRLFQVANGFLLQLDRTK